MIGQTNFYAVGPIVSNSGVLNYLAATGRFFPPILTAAQRTGIYTGLATTGVSQYDGLIVFQKPEQDLYVVQSGVWKKISLL